MYVCIYIYIYTYIHINTIHIYHYIVYILYYDKRYCPKRKRYLYYDIIVRIITIIMI